MSFPLLAVPLLLSSLTPPAPVIVDVPALRHVWKDPAELAAACAKAETDTDARLTALVAVPGDKRTFAGTFEAFDAILADHNETVWRLSFMKDVHPDAAVRDVASACDERAGKYVVALSARKDLYVAMKGLLDGGGLKLDAEQQRLADLTMMSFKRSGLSLSDKDRAKLVALRSRITELQTRFQKNLNEDKTTFEIKTDELAGLPPDFIAAHAHKDKPGVVVLSTKYPDYYPVMENAARESTRKKMETAFMNRGGAENRRLLDEAITLRAQAAKLLGYRTHADFVAEDRMAKDAATVAAFIKRMRMGLVPALDANKKSMLELKSAATGKSEKTINAWDWRYFMNQVKKRDFAIEDAVVRSYFPADKVISGMFRVYESLFGIVIAPVKGAAVWADGVALYEVRDAADKRLVAKFYVDLHPRDGKYGHAAEFTLSSGRALAGGYRIPMACLVLNFPAPTGGKPSTLSMDEVKTMFHEFGHVMHESLTTARYAQQSGTRTALDFVEAPSQMLENWAYLPEVLALISEDPGDKTKTMPAALALKLKAARKYNAGVHYSRQLFLASFDFAIHTADKGASDAVAKKTWKDVMGMPEAPDAHFAGTFGHMMGSYDGGYYGYLWSEVFAADMFTRFEKEGVMNTTAGRAYRDLVLARGKTVEPSALLRDFLGREPNEEAFLRSIGVTLTP